MAISEVMLVMLDVVSNNFLKKCEKNAKRILQNRFFELAELQIVEQIGLGLNKCPIANEFG